MPGRPPFAAVVVVSLALAACGRGPGEEPPPAAGSATVVIQGWPPGATGKLRFYRNATVDNLLVEAPVSAGGVVQYSLPTPAGLIAYSLTHVETLEPYACTHSAAAALQPGLAWHYIFLGQ